MSASPCACAAGSTTCANPAKSCSPIIRDGSGMMQCVAVKSNLPEPVFEALKNLTQESSFAVTGKIRAEPRAQGGYELDVEDAEVFQHVSEDHPYPITPKDHGVDFLMDHRHLWLRSRRQHAAIRVRHEVIKSIRDYLDARASLSSIPRSLLRRPAREPPRSLKWITSTTKRSI